MKSQTDEPLLCAASVNLHIWDPTLLLVSYSEILIFNTSSQLFPSLSHSPFGEENYQAKDEHEAVSPHNFSLF